MALSLPVALSEADRQQAPRTAVQIGVPIEAVFVHEGGYVLETVRPLVRATLEGFEEG